MYCVSSSRPSARLQTRAPLDLQRFATLLSAAHAATRPSCNCGEALTNYCVSWCRVPSFTGLATVRNRCPTPISPIPFGFFSLWLFTRQCNVMLPLPWTLACCALSRAVIRDDNRCFAHRRAHARQTINHSPGPTTCSSDCCARCGARDLRETGALGSVISRIRARSARSVSERAESRWQPRVRMTRGLGTLSVAIEDKSRSSRWSATR